MRKFGLICLDLLTYWMFYLYNQIDFSGNLKKKMEGTMNASNDIKTWVGRMASALIKDVLFVYHVGSCECLIDCLQWN